MRPMLEPELRWLNLRIRVVEFALILSPVGFLAYAARSESIELGVIALVVGVQNLSAWAVIRYFTK